MGDRAEPRQDRRQFLRALARGAMLGAMGAAAGALILRNRATSAAEACVNRGVCRGCPALKGCDLAQARSAKRVLGRR